MTLEKDGQFHPPQLLHFDETSNSFGYKNVLKCIDLQMI